MYQQMLPADPHLSSHTKEQSPTGRGCNRCPKDMLHRHLRGKGTAGLLGLLFPQTYTGNDTTRNNTLKLRGQSSVSIRKHTSHVL